MTLHKTRGLLLAAFGLVALFSVEANAQAPTVNANAVGNTVTIDVVLPAGALGFTLYAGTGPSLDNILPGGLNFPAANTHFVVNAPSGEYYLRARAFAGTITAPVFSAMSVEVHVTAGGPACTAPPGAPTLSVNVANAEVTLNWNAEPGATRYDIVYRDYRNVGIAESVTTASVTRYAPYVGTFYARVRVNTPCGIADSNEVSFGVTSLALGNGPRTPDPPPGQLLPMPGYGDAVVQDIARRYAGDLARHSGTYCKLENTWLFKLLRELRKYDSRWGLNWKRGYRNSEMSTDVVTYNPTNGPDVGAQQIYLVDTLGGECESNIPKFDFQAITSNTWNSGHAGLCGNYWCAEWTIAPYLAAGYPATSPQ